MTGMWHRAFAPATVANLGPGYDVLGLALDPALGLGDHCEVALRDHGRVEIEVTGDGGRLPTEPEKNCASVVARAVLARVGSRHGLSMRLTKGLPLGSGLGSSAASSAAAALATNAALGKPLSRRELVACARLGETVAAGTPHPDNVAPALLGGLLLMVERPAGLAIVRLPVPDELSIAVVIPALEVRSADARAVIPARVPVTDAVANLGSIGLFVSGLYRGDFDSLSQGIEDRLHQPYRIPLTRGFEAARAAALEAGALGVALSGSGPAMFALARGDERARAAGQALVAGFASQGVDAEFKHGAIAPAFETLTELI